MATASASGHPVATRDRIARWAAAAGLLVLGWIVTTFSLAQSAMNADPVQAHAIAPYSGLIAARAARQQLITTKAAQVAPRTVALARDALRLDPTAVDALSTLGLAAQAQGDTPQARRLFAAAQRLTRRDLVTHMWAIEDAVGRSDVPDALRHYDIALRTAKSSQDLLFPVLAQAIAQPEVRDGVVKLLRTDPAWGAEFVTFAARNAEPAVAAGLVARMGAAHVHVGPDAYGATVDRLLGAGDAATAWRVYVTQRAGVDRAHSRNPDFTATVPVPTAFDWQTVSDGSFSVALRQGLFDFALPPSIGGTVLRQTQLLPPGRYRLQGRSTGIDQAAQALPYWALNCSDGRQLGRVVVGSQFNGTFNVPAECAVQTLTLNARASDAVEGVSGQIERAQLAPIE